MNPQIWFQNRRQNTRRRAKPLSPFELPLPLPDGSSAHATEEPDIQTSSFTSHLGQSSESAPSQTDKAGPPTRSDLLFEHKVKEIEARTKDARSRLLSRFPECARLPRYMLLGPNNREWLSLKTSTSDIPARRNPELDASMNQAQQAPRTDKTSDQTPKIPPLSLTADTSRKPSQRSSAGIRSGMPTTEAQGSSGSLRTNPSDQLRNLFTDPSVVAALRHVASFTGRRRSKPHKASRQTQPETKESTPVVEKEESAKINESSRTSSSARIPVSLEGRAGRAQAVGKADEVEPRPEPVLPTGNPQRPRGLQRSQSAVSFGQLGATSHYDPIASQSRRPGNSRSKASDRWELFCDSDETDPQSADSAESMKKPAEADIARLRDESDAFFVANLEKLMAQRELKDASAAVEDATHPQPAGSAAAVKKPAGVTIARSREESDALFIVNLNKHMAQRAKDASAARKAAKRATSGSDGDPKPKRPNLVRATSSLPRLQTRYGEYKARPEKRNDLPVKPSKLAELVVSPGDSDKENWIPHDEPVQQQRMPVPQGQAGRQIKRPVLQDHGSVSNGKSMSGRLLSTKNKAAVASKDTASTKCTEKDGNLKGLDVVPGIPTVPNMLREEDDMSCVHTLLSLSQGTWR